MTMYRKQKFSVRYRIEKFILEDLIPSLPKIFTELISLIGVIVLFVIVALILALVM